MQMTGEPEQKGQSRQGTRLLWSFVPTWPLGSHDARRPISDTSRGALRSRRPVRVPGKRMAEMNRVGDRPTPKFSVEWAGQ